MVTATAAAMLMGAGQASVLMVSADKVKGDLTSFAECLGKQAEAVMEASRPGTGEASVGPPPAGSEFLSTSELDALVPLLSPAEAQTPHTSAAQMKEDIAAGVASAKANTKSVGDTTLPAMALSAVVEPPALSGGTEGNDRSARALPVVQAKTVDAGETVVDDGLQNGGVSSDGSMPVQGVTLPAAIEKDALPASTEVVQMDRRDQPVTEEQADQRTVEAGVVGLKKPSSQKGVEKKQEASAKSVAQYQDKSSLQTAVSTVQATSATLMPVAVLSAGQAAPAPSAVHEAAGAKTPSGGSGSGVSASKQTISVQTAVAGVAKISAEASGKQAVPIAQVAANGHVAPSPSSGGTAGDSKASQESAKVAVPAAGAAGDSGSKNANHALLVNSPGVASAGIAVAGAVNGSTMVHPAGPAQTVRTESSDIAQAPATHVGALDQSGTGSASSPLADAVHRTLSATPTTLEVGIPNGTEGWLKIRAEMAGGGVNASLSAASPAGHEMLHRELPALTAYLQQERVSVNSVVVHPLQATTALRAQPAAASGGFNPQTQQQGGQGGDGRRAPSGSVASEGAYPARGEAGPGEIDSLLPAVQYAVGGGWLSVRA